MDLYIYYKVKTGLANNLLSKVRNMQSELTGQCGVCASIKRRPTEKDGYHTWMEVYLAVPAQFENLLEQALVRAQLTSVIEGERHTEYFLDCNPCA